MSGPPPGGTSPGPASAAPPPAGATPPSDSIEVVNLARKLAAIGEPWRPRVAARVNDVDVKLVKLRGEFVWHRHDAEDELFLVIEGTLRMRLRDRELEIREGELVVIPRGVEHMPVADGEVHVLLVEPRGTLNTGNVRNERTVDEPEPI